MCSAVACVADACTRKRRIGLSRLAVLAPPHTRVLILRATLELGKGVSPKPSCGSPAQGSMFKVLLSE